MCLNIEQSNSSEIGKFTLQTDHEQFLPVLRKRSLAHEKNMRFLNCVLLTYAVEF